MENANKFYDVIEQTRQVLGLDCTNITSFNTWLHFLKVVEYNCIF